LLTIGSLCTGAGALDMAAQDVFGPARLAWVADTKPAAATLLAHRHPDVPNVGDLTVADWSAMEPVDILTAGWPCQPHSSAGKRLGEDDPRAIWPAVASVVATVRPSIFLGENVARVVSNGELARVVRSLADLGYVGSWRTLRASDVGACHRRDRLFLVAIDAAAHALRDGRHEGWTGDGDIERIAKAAQPGAAPGLTLLPPPTARNRHGADPRGKRSVGGGCAPDLQTVASLLPTPAVADSRNTRNATAGRTPENDRHHSGWTLSDVAFADRWGRYADAVARHGQVFGRPAPEPTVASSWTGKHQLSPRFVEWMMGYPEGWVTEAPGLAPRPRGERGAMLSILGDGAVRLQAATAYVELADRLGLRQLAA
jgi:DNA (cytosine-5)-methyltransferase 1